MAGTMHQGMQDMCKSPEGQNRWPCAAKLLNDPGDGLLVKDLWPPSFALTKSLAGPFFGACS